MWWDGYEKARSLDADTAVKTNSCRFTIHIGQRERKEEKEKAKSVIVELTTNTS
jgi:hypothetical protein